jgi:dihydroxynaphthoic acid synthetase
MTAVYTEPKVVRDLVDVPGFAFTDIIYEHNLDTHVARVVINRPRSRNAFTPHTMKEMVQAFAHAAQQPRIGVVILTGAEGTFCSGGDINWERETLAQGGFDTSTFVLNDALRHCLKPIVAVVEGFAVGGGNWLAAFCDMTIASSTALFGQNGPRVGSPAEGLQVAYLSRVIGEKKAREFWMLCRRYTAQQALELGLVNSVVEPEALEAEVDQWCSEILQLSPTVLKLVKATFERSVDGLRDTTIEHWRQLIAPDYLTSGEAREGQTAFLEKRAPDFWQYH